MKSTYYPEYIQRSNKSDITNHPCINCLLDTEKYIKNGSFKNISKGDRTWYSTYKKETQELQKDIKKFNPKEILEIGSGSGRIISAIYNLANKSKITGIEKDKLMVNYLKKRFKNKKNIHIKNNEIYNYLKKTKDTFDMSLCLMNTFGNINNKKTLESIISKSKLFIFSVYNNKYNKDRKEMYIARGHKEFIFKDNTYKINDYWVKGLVSKSFSKDEIKKMVLEAKGKIIKLKPTGILFYVVVEKNN